MVNDIAVQDFVNALKEAPTDTSTTYNATVSRVDDEGVVWVNLYGSDKETPTASTSTEVKMGDSVTVNWRNNKLYIGGNYTNPSAGIARVEKNEMATEFAIASAQTAQQAADVAVGEAERARIAADEAEQHASEAETQAGIATGYANDALTQLSVVEEVVDTLNWISEHGTYKKTTDTTVAENKMYFTLTGTAVSPTTLGDGTKLSNLESYYEKVNNVYVKTTDTTYNSSKTYYTVTAELVTSPTGNPSTSGYYEIDSIDTAVQNYISSHLALTDSGLYVVKDNSGYKVLLANDGLKVYDNQGHLVSTFGESIAFDSSRPQTIGNQSTYIKWYDSNNDHVADSIEIAGSNVSIASNVTIGGMPTKVSDLTNDSGYQTAGDVSGAYISATTLYYASNSTTPPSPPSAHVTTNNANTRGAWNIALPTYNASYPYLYICTETKTKGGTYAWTSVEQTTYTSAMADKASKSEAVAEEQRIYYRSSAESSGVAVKPNGNGLPTTWVTETGDKYNTNATTASGWSRKITPIANGTGSNVTKYLYLWTCIQKKTVNGTVTYGDILLDDSTTVIDGGKIVTGTVNANAVNASSGTFDTANIPNLDAGKITTGTLDANKVNITNLTVGTAQSGWDGLMNSEIDIGGRNLLYTAPKSYSSNAYLAYQLNLTENLKANGTYTIQFWDVTLDSSSTGIRPYWGGSSISLTTEPLVPDANGYCSATFLLGSTTSANAWINVYNPPSNHTGTSTSIGKWKLEKGNRATDYSPSPEDMAATATLYITDIGNDGIRVHDANTTDSSIVINSDGMEIFKGGTTPQYSIAKYGDEARIGAEADGHISINDERLDVYIDGTSQAYIGQLVSDDVPYFFARFGKSDSVVDSEGNVTIYTNPINVGLEDDPCIPRINISDGSKIIAALYKDSSYDFDPDYNYDTAGTLRLGGSALQSRGLRISGESRVSKTDSSSRQGVGHIRVNGNTQSYLELGVRDGGSSIELRNSQIAIDGKSSIDLFGPVYTDNDIYVKLHDGPIGEFYNESGSVSKGTGTSSSLVTGSAIELTPGRWMITAGVSFSSNANGIRYMKLNLSNAGDIGASQVCVPACSGYSTRITTSSIQSIGTTQNVRLYVMQNSNTNLTVDWDIRAVRIQ